MMSNTARQKIARLVAGGNPRVLDLFAGCGGLSLGFQAAGFEIAAAIEIDPDAARAHGINFHDGRPEHCVAREIAVVHPDDLTGELNLGPAAQAFLVHCHGAQAALEFRPAERRGAPRRDGDELCDLTVWQRHEHPHDT